MKSLNLDKMYLTLTALFLFYYFMAFFLPLTHDDWDWYSQYGVQMWQEKYANLNGRYLGNILETVAVRLDWFRWISYALISMAMIYIIVRFTHNTKQPLYYLIAFILMVTIPSEIYKQTYGWFAGFYNYVPATLCVVFILWFIVTVLFERRGLTPVTNIVFYIICFIGQFFMENTTLFNSMILVLAIALNLLLYRQINPKFIVGLLLSVAGTLIMFLNPNYRKIFFEGSSYQNISSETGLVDKIFHTVTTTIPDWVFFNQIVILSLIITVVLVMLYRSTVLYSLPKMKIGLTVSGLLILPIYYFFIYKQFELQNFHSITIANLLNTVICIIFLGAMIYAIHLVIGQKEVRYTLYLLLASTLLVCAPLVIVSPLGPRNFYTVYVIYSIILLILLVQLNVMHALWRNMIVGIAIMFGVVYLSGFCYIHYQNETRIANLKQEVKEHPDKDFYTMEKLPFEHYLHHATPTSEKYQTLFNKYEGLPADTKVKYVPFGSEEKKSD
ncbi:MAG: DUF6056 family protein [Staphylococcus equorum]